MNFVLHVIQSIILFIDQMVYGAAIKVFNLIMDISNARVFSNETISEFSNKVYALLGIFMLFKVALSMINYIVNPDDFSDKQKGSSKLIVNILTTLVLIVLTPRIFSEAMDLQYLILEENLLGKVILGEDSDNEVKDSGESIAMSLFGSFYHYESNSHLGSLPHTQNGQYYMYSTYDGAFTKKENKGDNNAYAGIWNDTSTYLAILSTAAGVILFLVFVQFCFDIAIRTVKLGFLQIIAPIPLISRIDPKGAKDGMFNKWLKQCTSTYISLFIRLGTVYFAVYAINIIMRNEMQTNNILVTAMIILGALLFAKQLPKLLEDLFGIKFDSKFTLNPLKRLEDDAFGGKMLTGATAGLMTRGVPGMISGGWQGLTKNKGFSDVRDAQANQRRALRIARDNGSTFLGRTGMRINNALGMDNDIDRYEREENILANKINEINEAQRADRTIMKNNKEISDAFGEEKSHALKNIEAGKAGALSLEFNKRKAHIENLKSQMAAYQQQANDMSLTVSQRDAASLAASSMEDVISRQEADDGLWLNKTAVYQYIDQNGAVDDGNGGTLKIDQELVDKRNYTNELVKVHLGEKEYNDFSARNASGRKDYSDDLSEKNRTINKNFVKSDAEKAELESQRDALKEKKRVAQANLNAVRAQKK